MMVIFSLISMIAQADPASHGWVAAAAIPLAAYYVYRNTTKKQGLFSRLLQKWMMRRLKSKGRKLNARNVFGILSILSLVLGLALGSAVLLIMFMLFLFAAIFS